MGKSSRPDEAENLDLLVKVAHMIVDDDGWLEDAACKPEWWETSMFFPSKGSPNAAATRDVLNLCREQCPVRRECLAYSLIHNETLGIWGGVMVRSRRQLRRAVRDRLPHPAPRFLLGPLLHVQGSTATTADGDDGLPVIHAVQDEDMTEHDPSDEVIERRKREAQRIAAERSEAMVSGYRHLMGHGDHDQDDEDEAERRARSQNLA